MRTYLQTAAMAIGFILFLFAETSVMAQEHWAKDQTNPVFKEFGTWAQDGVMSPCVIFEDNLFKMWYSAKGCSGHVIGYANSVDGINWQPNEKPLFPFGIIGVWDEDRKHPCVVRVNDTLKMWFSGSSDNFNMEIAIGYAWSVDNKTWYACSKPVLEKGVSGSWDERSVFKPSVYYDGEIYHMWYNGCQGTSLTEPMQVGYAKSVDGINWRKNYVNNPVLTIGEPETFYDTWIQSSSVIFKDDEYKMWFTGWDNTSITPHKYIRIGYATSPDCINWDVQNNDLAVMDVGKAPNWDLYSIKYPSVIFHEGQYKMWFTGFNGYTHRIGYAAGFQAVEVPADVSTIQEGISVINDGEVVLVSPGTYHENIDFQGKAITIASKYLLDGDETYIDNTIIDGSKAKNAKRSSVVYFVSGEDTNSVLKGFTITGGNGTLSYLYDYSITGGGIYCAGSGAKIENNKIVNNSCIGNAYVVAGGGIYSDAKSDGLMVVRHNLISDNTVINNRTGFQKSYVFGGGMALDNDAIITDNIITDNSVIHARDGQALGGGIEVWRSKSVIKNNTITGNTVKSNGKIYMSWGGGLFGQQLEKGSVISGNLVSYNQVMGDVGKGGGIGLWQTCDNFKIDANIIDNNRAFDGAGIALGFDQRTEISNNAIMFNRANSTGGGIYLRDIYFVDKNVFRPSNKIDAGNQGNPNASILCVIANNTLYDNCSGGYGDGIGAHYVPNYFLAFNNIIYCKTSMFPRNPIYLGNMANAYIFNNVINVNWIQGEGNYIDDGSNIFVDPEVIDKTSHLSWYSPCVNAGVATVNISGVLYNAPSTDIDGEPRPYLSTIPDIGADETQSIFVQIQENKSENEFELAAFPNPFSDNINFSYSIYNNSFVSFTIIDSQGKLIKTLMNEMRTAGDYQFIFDGTTLPPGIYLGVLKTATKTQTTKFIKLR